MPLPNKKEKKYNQSLSGFFGEFGTGSAAKVFFIQSGLSPENLDKIKLISDIRGSERWSVRDLFQREVDDDRVTNSLIPYFEDDRKIKFFNPLTLTLLPNKDMSDGSKILKKIPKVEIREESIEGRDWIIYEADPYFRFLFAKGAPEYGIAEWQDKHVNIVAIDGQHRLSALKRYFDDPKSDSKHKDFLKWTVPVVLLTLRSLDYGNEQLTLLDVTRSLFVYINKEAKKPSESRQILLSDESINAVCTQEILEYAHENDLKPYDDRENHKIPLLFFAWRDSDESPCHLKEVKEIYDWLAEYILGDDFDDSQKATLNINPNHALNDLFIGDKKKRRLTAEFAKILRTEFSNKILPGITHLLENFIPYKNYIEKLRDLEGEILKESDLARHAFAELRFGGHQGPKKQNLAIRDIKENLIDQICGDKDTLGPILKQDIGMRGVICAFGELRTWHRQSIKKAVSYLDYSKWFTDSLNFAFQDGWLDSTNKKRTLLLHITHDQHDTTQNYRLGDTKKALGSFLVLVVGAFGMKNFGHPKDEVFNDLKDKYLSNLEDTIMKGIKKEERAALKSEFPQGPELNDAVNKAAAKRTKMHVKKIASALDSILKT